jgi:ATP-binding cassette subfamily C (CFTR/MRP) protein 10
MVSSCYDKKQDEGEELNGSINATHRVQRKLFVDASATVEIDSSNSECTVERVSINCDTKNKVHIYESFSDGTPCKPSAIRGEETIEGVNEVEVEKEVEKEVEEGDREKLVMERMEQGQIDSAVYRGYFSAAGIPLCLLVLLSTLLMQITSNGMSFWLAYWTDHTPKQMKSSMLARHLSDGSGTTNSHLASANINSFSTSSSSSSPHDSFQYQFTVPKFHPSLPDIVTDSVFLQVAGTIVLVNIVSTLLRSFLFARGGLKAATEIYRKLTVAVFHTDISFFEKTSVGKIVNRFGSDMERVDDQLPFMLNIVLAQIFLLLGSFIVIAITDPLVIIVIVVVSVIYYRLQVSF